MIPFENWGLIDYGLAYQKQLETLKHYQKEKNASDERLILCSHPSIVTLGKKSQIDDVTDWDGPIKKVERGGRATYHGPGQSVTYLIFDIKKRGNDIMLLLRSLEAAAIKTFAAFNVQAYGDNDNTGVWANHKKLASIGMAIQRGVTYHGMAINLYADARAFQGINPCGFRSDIMTDLESVTGQQVNRIQFENILQSNLQTQLKQAFYSTKFQNK